MRVCVFVCQGRGELNAPPVHPALNVFSHSLGFALKRPSRNRTTEQSNETALFSLGTARGNNVVFTVGKIIQVFTPSSAFETQCIIPFQ